jgi:hypothetical protein
MAKAGEMLGVKKQSIAERFKKSECFIFRDRYLLPRATAQEVRKIACI